MSELPDNGMVHLSSPYSVPETLQRLESLLKTKGVAVFCRIDHSREAEKAGLKMNPTQLLIFGSPKAGTPLMVASPTLAIDLPLKALIWEDAGGKVWVSYSSAEYLKLRHNIGDELLKNIAGIGPLLEKAVEQSRNFFAAVNYSISRRQEIKIGAAGALAIHGQNIHMPAE
jgi:uncharacterized protein (DUF302 family)